MGMTSAVSFLCIQQLASEFWMRVVARVEHVPQADGSVHHHMPPHSIFTPQLNAALVDGTPWAGRLVVPLVQSLGGPPRSPLTRAVAVTRQAPMLRSRMPLVSWAIATREEVSDMRVPPGISAADYAKALQEFAGVVGSTWVFTSDEDVDSIVMRIRLLTEPEERLASGAVAPASTEQVQQVVRIANRYRIPLYTISTGRTWAMAVPRPPTRQRRAGPQAHEPDPRGQ